MTVQSICSVAAVNTSAESILHYLLFITVSRCRAFLETKLIQNVCG